MRNYKPRTYISSNNKIWDYIKFTKKDKVLCDFIDYLAFYWKRNRLKTIHLLSSDNGPSFYVGRISIDKEEWLWTFKAYGNYSYMWYSVKLFRIWEIQIWWEVVLKVDFYGKWLKIVREDNLWSNIELIFKSYFMMDEIKITRVDYTVDCWKYNFKKKNTLKTSIKGKIEKENNIEYLVFGRKWQSARFIRYYDKKKEIITKGTSWLYPEYFGYSEIMRYELQINSDGFDPIDRYMKIWDIKKFIDFGFTILNNTSSHKKRTKDESLFYRIKYWIRKLQREKDQQTLDKIKLLLFSPEEICNIDSLVWCEILEAEKPFDHF